MAELGGAVRLSHNDKLTDETERHILKINEFWLKKCGWK